MLNKEEARARGKAYRRSLGETERAALDQRLLVHCREELDWDGYRRVHVFLPAPRQGEINTWPLVEWIWRAHPAMQVYAPRLVSGGMEQVEIGLETRFRRNEFDIPEPMGGAVLDVGAPMDLVLVPLLGFDAQGHRAGYGGGYYDRFLAMRPGVQAVGLAYDGLRIEEGVATEAHDVALKAVVTESGIWTYS